MPSTMPSVPSAPTGHVHEPVDVRDEVALGRARGGVPASRKLSTQACWWRGVVAVAQRVRLPAAGPADGVVVGARGAGDRSSSARPRWSSSTVPVDEEDVALGGDGVGAPSSARSGRRRRRAGSRRPGCRRGRRSAASARRATTPRPRRPGRRRPRRARPATAAIGAHRPAAGTSSVFSNARCRSGRRGRGTGRGSGRRRRQAVTPHRRRGVAGAVVERVGGVGQRARARRARPAARSTAPGARLAVEVQRAVVVDRAPT